MVSAAEAVEVARDQARRGGLVVEAVGDLVHRAAREVEGGLLPSCQLALAHGGRVVVAVTLGDADDADRYPIFSCTKAITAAGVWRLLSDGRLDRHQSVVELVPWLGSASDGEHRDRMSRVTVTHLLTHTAGFPQAPLGPPAWDTPAGRKKRMARWRCVTEPGTQFEYHPTAAHWVLAEVVEAVTGIDHRAWVRDQVIAPVGLTRMQLGLPVGVPVPNGQPAREVVVVGEAPSATEIEAALGVRIDLADLVGEVTDEAKVSLGRPDVLAVGIPGGGAVSTAADLAMLYQAFLHDPGGLWDPDVLTLGAAEVCCDLPDPLTGVPAHRTLGLVLAGDDGHAAARGFGHTVSPGAFGHDGAGGQIAFADPATGVSFAYVTDGHDRNVLREWRRTAGIASRAGRCTPTGR